MHLGLEAETAFMDRPDWLKTGTAVSRYVTFCPISMTTEKRRPAKAKQTPGVSPICPTGVTADEKSALAHQYDMELQCFTRWSLICGVWMERCQPTPGAKDYGSVCERRRAQMVHRKHDPVVWILGVLCMGARDKWFVFLCFWDNF